VGGPSNDGSSKESKGGSKGGKGGSKGGKGGSKGGSSKGKRERNLGSKNPSKGGKGGSKGGKGGSKGGSSKESKGSLTPSNGGPEKRGPYIYLKDTHEWCTSTSEPLASEGGSTKLPKDSSSKGGKGGSKGGKGGSKGGKGGSKGGSSKGSKGGKGGSKGGSSKESKGGLKTSSNGGSEKVKSGGSEKDKPLPSNGGLEKDKLGDSAKDKPLTSYGSSAPTPPNLPQVPPPTSPQIDKARCGGVVEIKSSAKAKCSMGDFGANNLKVVGSDGETVRFKLQHSFCKSDLKPAVVWFDNPDQQKSLDYCWEIDKIGCNKPFEEKSNAEFRAKCTDGYATVAITAGADCAKNDVCFSHSGPMDIVEPACQKKMSSPEFNPNKRCYWELKVPCGCERRSLEALPQNLETSMTSSSEIVTKAEPEEALQIPVDKCTASDYVNPITIISQDAETVTFSVSQVWKGCDATSSSRDRRLGWIATDYVNKDDELICAKMQSLDCGFSMTYTAMCTEGDTVVDLYTYDEDPAVFGQTDGTVVVVPLACEPFGDETKMCHFRYIVSCESSKGSDTSETEVNPEEKPRHFWFF
jgi:hypothetical protein